MLLQDTVSIFMGKGNYAYYKKMIPNLIKNQYCEVPLHLARPGGHQKVKVRCDGCGREFFQSLYRRKESQASGEGDYCTHCGYIKRKAVFLQMYGVDNPMKVEDIKEKQAERYYYLKKRGIKQIRFIFKNRHHSRLPCDSLLLQLKDVAYQLIEAASVNWVHIELEEQIIITKAWIYTYKFLNNNLLIHRND